ncbi:BON domain-containing protein [Novosphingobium sp. M1R2S20]|uniref:BON domain-containing protein n=1 Tax=Novosphingobium rhizovicinum TaxID=3228928 RepID=A0ABV3RB95_9SPHN
MNDRDRERQNMQGRGQQYGGGNFRGGESYDTPRQPHQWQSDSSAQAGGDWQSAAPGRSGEDHPRDYRFSGQGDPDYGNRSSWRGGQGDWRSESQGRGYGYGRDRSERGYRGGRERQGDWAQRGPSAGYGRGRDQAYYSRDFDASGGNDFADFTSEDYGGRDFYNRGGVSGGMRSSESYRPSYGISSWWRGDDDNGNRSRSEFDDWRRYGENRGFLERAGDEIASWFGDEDASRRREMDHRADDRRTDHRGRGPSGYTRSDERIREDANDHLTHDWGVDASNIRVSVKDGEVTLDGTVDSRSAKRRAEDCVDCVSGVKHVQNNLRVEERNTGTHGSAFSGDWSDNNRSGATGSGQTGSSSSSSNQTTGAHTTEGIGSAASAGVSNASSPRSSGRTT